MLCDNVGDCLYSKTRGVAEISEYPDDECVAQCPNGNRFLCYNSTETDRNGVVCANKVSKHTYGIYDEKFVVN